MAPQDSFIDEEEDTCPLCIEEFDLSDRNFRPCPCGYQICQFCFNNLKNNLNGLCPACRRPYDEKTIQWKVVTQEEIAEFRANIQKNQKKRAAEQRQKEVQKREVDKGNRKNLVGVRVVQKNLVYVTGLTPTVPEDELLKTLRRPEFFGQYGNIQKISISNRKAPDGQPQSLGIYVTFEKKDDATRCIQAVNGSMNGDRVLKAQLGTTKYCSAWLRHEQCGNRQCMFLHELGDEEDSYSRQDLSSLNSVYTQRPLSNNNNNNNNNAASSSRSASRQQGLPPQQAAVAQAMVRTSSKDGSEIGDGPALPATANWARTTQQRSRRGSHATSGAASSPAISNALPVTTESAQEAIDSSQDDPAPTPAAASRRAEKKVASSEPSPDRGPTPVERPPVKDPYAQPDMNDIMRLIAACPDFRAPQGLDDSEVPLFDMAGGLRRRAMREEEENRLGETAEPVPEPLETEEGEPESGSLALGGEPEDRDQGRDAPGFDQRRNATQPPIQRNNAEGIFGPALTSAYAQGSTNPGSIGSRTMTPQQQQQQQLFMRPQSSFVDQMPPGISNPQSQSSLFQGQGHTRQQSRFSFANEGTASSTNVKLTANPRIMAQQSSMMPSTYHSQPSGQFYASSMPGPPPGLKSTGTPPVSGGMFGQGHSFGGSGFGIGSKDNPNDLLQNLIRGRGTGSGQAHDAGKREYFSSFPNQYPPSSSSTPAPASGAGIMASLYATQPGGFQDFGPKQKKKGKKHRHANTSSSGGGALVDLADPSILQARLPHQQQGTNAGVGQGLFGGQSQGGYNPNMMYGGAGANYGRW
ncbi:CCR4-NOT transcription complex subunit 4 [Apiospora marii]|uniref:CCR4-NOT transcription complex subunit 4 n=1 Tax=Apiospora marii TaxID=335849 RepID=A0ABR1RTF6_9PEZI